MAAEHGPTAGEYIGHHLTHLQNKPMQGVIDFSVFNLDSIFFAVVLGILGSFLLWKAAKSATSGVPGRFQAAVEILVEMVDNQAKGIIHNANSRKLVAPLALTVFVWIYMPSRSRGFSIFRWTISTRCRSCWLTCGKRTSMA